MRLIAWVVIVLVLASCNFLDSMSEIRTQADNAASSLETDLGVRPLVGWNLNNGTLMNVNFAFDGRKVANIQLSQLKAKVDAATVAAFKAKPVSVTVSATWRD